MRYEPNPHKGLTQLLTQNVKAVDLWVFILIWCSTFTILLNVRLRLTLEFPKIFLSCVCPFLKLTPYSNTIVGSFKGGSPERSNTNEIWIQLTHKGLTPLLTQNLKQWVYGSSSLYGAPQLSQFYSMWDLDSQLDSQHNKENGEQLIYMFFYVSLPREKISIYRYKRQSNESNSKSTI